MAYKTGIMVGKSTVGLFSSLWQSKIREVQFGQCSNDSVDIWDSQLIRGWKNIF